MDRIPFRLNLMQRSASRAHSLPEGRKKKKKKKKKKNKHTHTHTHEVSEVGGVCQGTDRGTQKLHHSPTLLENEGFCVPWSMPTIHHEEFDQKHKRGD